MALFNETDFRELASGRRRGIAAGLGRGLLRLAETPYTLAVQWRNGRFDSGRRPIERVGVPVISVGNLTLGGVGKTPLVEWLAGWLIARGVRVGLVSRGYGAAAGTRNDEALELAQKLPDTPHIQNPDRVAAARRAIDEFGCQCILLDDAFQHRRLHRDLDIVVLDALEPFGFGHVFPRGLLREPIANLRRADVIVLSRADCVDQQERERIRAVAMRHAPHALWIEAAHAPQYLQSSSGEQAPLSTVAGQSVAAFCALGNPAGFRATLAGLGCRVVAMREYPDHFPFPPAEIESLAKWAAESKAALALCTRKDLVKLNIDRLGQSPLWAVVVELQIAAGLAELESRLAEILPRRREAREEKK